eukprot:1285053-Ditylum_brightwellii.AAC.1
MSPGKQKKTFCDYHGLCHHDTDKCNLCKLVGSLQEARSDHTPYHDTTEALAGLVFQGHQKVGQKVQPNRQRGQGSQHVYQGQDQRDNQRAQPQHARNKQL